MVKRYIYLPGCSMQRKGQGKEVMYCLYYVCEMQFLSVVMTVVLGQ